MISVFTSSYYLIIFVLLILQPRFHFCFGYGLFSFSLVHGSSCISDSTCVGDSTILSQAFTCMYGTCQCRSDTYTYTTMYERLQQAGAYYYHTTDMQLYDEGTCVPCMFYQFIFILTHTHMRTRKQTRSYDWDGSGIAIHLILLL